MDAAVYLNFAIQAFQRNNPIVEVSSRLTAMIHFVLNYKSNQKLNRYRHSLYMQQLQRMEGYLSEGSPYTQQQGEKMNRKF